MKQLAKPLVGQLREGLFSTDAATALDTRIKFTRSAFLDPDAVDHPIFTSWVGSSAYITAEGVKRALSRSQNPTALFAAGKAGLPLLILYSEIDAQINNEVTVNEVGGVFVDKRVVVVPGAGHAVFHGNQSRVVAEIVSFIGGKSTD